MKTSLPNIAAACFGLLAGLMLAVASRESQTQASHERDLQDTTIINPIAEKPTFPAIADDSLPLSPVDEVPVPPPLALSVDAHDVVALVPASGECANGVCAPRAATVHRYQPQTRRGLFGGRLFRRR